MSEAVIVTRDLFDHADSEDLTFKVPQGITRDIVIAISKYKNEPEWMLQKRLDAFDAFEMLPMPDWGPDISSLDLNKITYFAIPNAKNNSTDWEELPQEIKKTFDRLGIPEAEKTALAGVGAQYESRVVYHNIKKEWEDKGVIFLDMDVAVQEHPELVKKYFMTQCVPVTLHKFVALHAAVWSGGTFLYVPEGVKIDLPLQAYFRMNARKMGQFEHTLIVVEKGAQVHYIEGCSAPQYNVNSLHAGCVEVVVKDGARARYSSVENWSKNTFNLNTKRGVVHKDGFLEWIGGNLGSGCTMLYPCSILLGENARADHVGIAFAGKAQNQDVGAKVYHLAPNTSSLIKSKSISRDGGITTYRGLVKISPNAFNAKSSVQCDALMMDNISTSDTVPYIEVQNNTADVAHEATVGKIGEEQIFYLMSRGISEEDAVQMIVAGFIEPVVKELPLEYAVEMNRLIQLEMEGSLG
ncbi:Fe-S cluster assembly protein SufB [Candidatus Woesearchaeota archaeon]|nr:Fe-S cluster assembly protein SufB [Candidatus Woesearchaeota archaeon]